MYDVIIIGAGPAGLSAALILGRCRRHVLICDSAKPRFAEQLTVITLWMQTQTNRS